jgi:PAS domain-containing protein
MLGRQVVTQLELRRRQHELERSLAVHKKSEQSKADIFRAIDHGLEGLAFLDKQGCFTYMNPAHAAIYGYKPEELINRSWKILYAPEWVAKIEQQYFPILLHVSADTRIETMAEATNLGATEYLKKPFSQERLMKAVELFLPRPTDRQEPQLRQA